MSLTFNYASSNSGPYLQSPTAFISTTIPLSVAAWINPLGLVAGAFAPIQGYSIINDGTGIRSGMSLEANSLKPYGKLWPSSIPNLYANSPLPGTSPTPTPGWYHVAVVVIDTLTRYCYLNGVPGPNVAGTGTAFTPDTIRIGSLVWQGTTVWIFNGTIAFPAFWNVALTGAEITSLAKGISAKKIRPQSLISYCRLVGASPEPDFKGRQWSVNTPAGSIVKAA